MLARRPAPRSLTPNRCAAQQQPPTEQSSTRSITPPPPEDAAAAPSSSATGSSRSGTPGSLPSRTVYTAAAASPRSRATSQALLAVSPGRGSAKRGTPVSSAGGIGGASGASRSQQVTCSRQSAPLSASSIGCEVCTVAAYRRFAASKGGWRSVPETLRPRRAQSEAWTGGGAADGGASPPSPGREHAAHTAPSPPDALATVPQAWHCAGDRRIWGGERLSRTGSSAAAASSGRAAKVRQSRRGGMEALDERD
mmetsp:Transcript_14279/g.46128  ORF Transcript_14279/g.46128 Transcript_14279/m.46128 type:complete len:253 (+) Transcript_14279:226-984(+)